MKIQFSRGLVWALQAVAMLAMGGSARGAGLIASDGAAGDLFGLCSYVSGNLVVVGAHQKDIGSNTDQGGAYIFRGDIFNAGTFNEAVQLRSSDGAASDWFAGQGVGVAVSGACNIAVVSAPLHDTGGNANRGAGYV